MFTMFDLLEPRARGLAADFSASLPSPLRLVREKDGMLLMLDLPGVAREDLRLARAGRTVRLEGVRRDASGERRMDRSFRLPEGSGEVVPSLQDGVLTLRISRSQDSAEQELEVH